MTFQSTTTSSAPTFTAPDIEDGKIPTSHLPSDIVMEIRRNYQDAVRNGSEEDGIEVLESGLHILRNRPPEASDQWSIGEAQILLDLGRMVEARDALTHCDCQLRTRGNAPVRRPSLRKSPSAADVKFEADMLRFNNRNNLEDLLDTSLRAEDWDRAREAAETLSRIDSGYLDIEKKMDRYRKCRYIMNLGILAEADGDSGKALRIYNQGCFATELFHKHFDPPSAHVNGLDHKDSSNLFFSAARICVLFHKETASHKRTVTPKQFTSKFEHGPIPCSPPLSEPDWKHQALHFMEQGRSRALLESILKGDTKQPVVSATARKYAMANVALAARESIRIKKREAKRNAAEARPVIFSSRANQQRPSQDYALLGLNGDPSPPRYPSSAFENLLPPKPRSLALAPLLDTTGLDDFRYAQTLPSPSSYESDTESITTERANARSQARLRWQKAILYALANPTLKAALQTPSPTEDASKIGAKIPKDAAVIEYALLTAPPEGLITIVITSDGVEDCAWQNIATLEIRNDVKDLLSSVQTLATGSSTGKRKRTTLTLDELREKLFSILIRPIEKSLAGKKRLVIIPSGELAHIPWTLLLHLPVSIIPSLSIWDQLESDPRDYQTPSRVSVVSNPPRNADGSLRDKDIPFSYIEAFYVARLYKNVPFLADENNREQFQKWVAMTRVLHICAHSTFDTQDPAKSQIQLFSSPLTIHDWRDLAIKADLVIFSSCLSGVSKAFYSGSAFGFAHALLGAGTRAFIGSLWPVDDKATLLLMMMFHEQLRKFSPAEALHIAQMNMRTLTQDNVWELVIMLRRKLEHADVRKFVDAHTYWIEELDNMKADELLSFREPRCWAAFVLTGYGFQRVQ